VHPLKIGWGHHPAVEDSRRVFWLLRRVMSIGDPMKTRTHFNHRIDMLDDDGEILEHLAGIEDFALAEATWQAAVKRWPKAAIMLRQGSRVVFDSRRPRLVK
jgi:hypothetical protein